MAPRLYVTDNVIASVRKAHETFTHTVLVYSPVSIRPFYLRTDQLDIEPVHIWLPWKRETLASLERWRARGGLLVSRCPDLEAIGSADVVIFTESSFALSRLARAVSIAHEHVVIERPFTWCKHEETVDVRTPSVETLRALWAHCQGKAMTDDELAQASGILKTRLQLMRARLRPAEEWRLLPRIAPESSALRAAWDWIGDGRNASRKAVRLAGHQKAVQELARLGHVVLEKRYVYPGVEPNWAALERKRAGALANLTAVQVLVNSLPGHFLET
ncbi:hypothetical protein [Paraburkholderia sp. CNPSo 3281]|uniref:hypothetical protein n=1 Tax=Paraburkholderia sp. CNPSo 3281 TaxID=2940933 RepID=UPI0020B7F9B8|nr:hypothetical protein [Paraburkholderia sp. CNPSo 3281]MCP3714893.1 hypothetical protein [Paraburkholderia sp. CNPSo 3281]